MPRLRLYNAAASRLLGPLVRAEQLDGVLPLYDASQPLADASFDHAHAVFLTPVLEALLVKLMSALCQA